jgi:two-component system sensor histidine kinase QseC
MTLRLRLLIAIGLSLMVLWSSAAVWTIRGLDQNLQRTLDERLAMSARMVAGLVAQFGASGARELSAHGELTVPGSRGIACQIRSLRGKVIATTRGGHEPLRTSVPGYHYSTADGERWRTYTLLSPGFEITTADRLDERALLRRRTALAAGIPFMIAAIGGLLALWFGAGRALAPLSGLQRTLAARPPDATEAVDGSRLPGELRPLIGALNDLLRRMGQALQRERSFTNDAAHELRTPLTVVDTHLQVARLTAGPEAQPALADATTGVERMRSTLDQLLMLARIEGALPFDEGTLIDVTEVVNRAIASARSDATARVLIDIEDGTPLVDLPPQLAVIALRNLIDNALRYSTAGSAVEIYARNSAATVHLDVIDHGPGMNQDQLREATRRFWRASADSTGCGLGLALVEAIVRRFGGTLSLQLSPPHGLAAELILPMRPSVPRAE